MPTTLRVRTGDGVNSVLIDAVVQLPDSGHSFGVAGTVQAPGHAAVAITGSPLTGPNNPGAGNLFWQIVVDWTSGAASVQQSSTADPSPVDEGPKGLPTVLAGLMPAAALQAGTPVLGRAATPADASTSVVIMRQTLTSTSPAAAWANTTTTTPNNY